MITESKFKTVKYKLHKLCFEMKMTKLGVSHFTSISGHFFAKYNNNCHKTEVVTVTLNGPTNMSKS